MNRGPDGLETDWAAVGVAKSVESQESSSVTSSFLLLVVMPGATSSFLLLVAMPLVTASFLF